MSLGCRTLTYTSINPYILAKTVFQGGSLAGFAIKSMCLMCVCVFVSTTFWNVGLLCPILMPHVLYHDILDNQVRRTPNLSRLWRSHSVGCQRRQTNVHPKDPNSPPIEEQTSGSFFFFQSYQTTRQRHPPKPSTAVTAGAVAGPFATLGLDPGCPVPLLQPSAVR